MSLTASQPLDVPLITNPSQSDAASTNTSVVRTSTTSKGSTTSTKHGQTDVNLVSWDGQLEDEKNETTARLTNPQGWCRLKKGITLAIVSTSAACVTCTSSIVSNTYHELQQEFHVSAQTAILGMSLFILGLGLGPVLLGPLSEFFGRKPVYVVSFGAFCLLGLPVSFASHFAMFATFRFLTGFVGSAFLSIAGGTVADLYAPHDALVPMAFYTFAIFLGPIFGAPLGGFIAYNFGWRWVFWAMNIWSALMWAALLFFVPETFAPIILTRRAEQLRKDIGNDELHSAHELVMREKSIAASIRGNSTKVLQLLACEPMLLLLCIWSALLLSIFYLLFEAFPVVFAKHGFNLWQTSLTFTGILFGFIAALAAMPFFSRLYSKAVEASGGSAPPEARLPMAMVGSIVAPISLFCFAFTTYESIHWIVPIIASAPFGAAIFWIYTSIFTYTTDAWRPVAASAMGANSLLRSLAAAALPMIANQLYRAMGTAGATSLLAGLNVLMIPVPFLLYKYGAKLRARSRFAR